MCLARAVTYEISFFRCGYGRNLGALYIGVAEFAVAGLPVGMRFGADCCRLDWLIRAVVSDNEIFAIRKQIGLYVVILVRIGGGLRVETLGDLEAGNSSAQMPTAKRSTRHVA